eukprot:scaffold120849_cov18-Tisochrysis_lutea.AAC.1
MFGATSSVHELQGFRRRIELSNSTCGTHTLQVCNAPKRRVSIHTHHHAHVINWPLSARSLSPQSQPAEIPHDSSPWHQYPASQGTSREPQSTPSPLKHGPPAPLLSNHPAQGSIPQAPVNPPARQQHQQHHQTVQRHTSSSNTKYSLRAGVQRRANVHAGSGRGRDQGWGPQGAPAGTGPDVSVEEREGKGYIVVPDVGEEEDAEASSGPQVRMKEDAGGDQG